MPTTPCKDICDTLAEEHLSMFAWLYRSLPSTASKQQTAAKHLEQMFRCSVRAALHFRIDPTTAQDIGGCGTHLWLVWVASAWTLGGCTFCSPEYVAGCSTWRLVFLRLSHSFGSTKDSAGLPTCGKNTISRVS